MSVFIKISRRLLSPRKHALSGIFRVHMGDGSILYSNLKGKYALILDGNHTHVEIQGWNSCKISSHISVGPLGGNGADGCDAGAMLCPLYKLQR